MFSEFLNNNINTYTDSAAAITVIDDNYAACESKAIKVSFRRVFLFDYSQKKY